MKPIIITPSLVLLLLCGPVHAWESDLHFGLTKWLAMQAGFAEPDAQLIAAGTLNMDQGIFDARHLVFHYACLGRDPQASELVRDAHFPSFAKIPNTPSARKVEAGGKAARRRANQEAKPSVETKEERTYELSKFGETLHTLQDSWSHQGIPDTPSLLFLSCSEKLSWGHPQDRGGWGSHDADLTHLHPRDTIETAKATYEFMDIYLKNRNWPRSGKSWAVFEGEVKKFAGLATKTAKKAWFIQQGFTDVEFLDETTLENGEELFGYSARMARASGTMPPDAVAGKDVLEVPAEVEIFFRAFFDAWLTEPTYEPILERFVDVDQAVRHLRAERPDRETGRDLFVARLWIWRLRDHGLANKLGHGIRESNTAEPFSTLRQNFKTLQALTNFKSTYDGLIPIAANKTPYLIVPMPVQRGANAGSRFAALARFKNAPHDAVLVTVAKTEKDWRVVGLDWTVDH